MYNEDVIFDTPTRRSDGHYWSHMVAKDEKTLHTIAQAIGLKREWFQNHNVERPHYDIKTHKKREMAVARGAKMVSSKYLVYYLRHHYKKQSSLNL